MKLNMTHLRNPRCWRRRLVSRPQHCSSCLSALACGLRSRRTALPCRSHGRMYSVAIAAGSWCDQPCRPLCPYTTLFLQDQGPLLGRTRWQPEAAACRASKASRHRPDWSGTLRPCRTGCSCPGARTCSRMPHRAERHARRTRGAPPGCGAPAPAAATTARCAFTTRGGGGGGRGRHSAPRCCQPLCLSALSTVRVSASVASATVTEALLAIPVVALVGIVSNLTEHIRLVTLDIFMGNSCWHCRGQTIMMNSQPFCHKRFPGSDDLRE